MPAIVSATNTTSPSLLARIGRDPPKIFRFANPICFGLRSTLPGFVIYGNRRVTTAIGCKAHVQHAQRLPSLPSFKTRRPADPVRRTHTRKSTKRIAPAHPRAPESLSLRKIVPSVTRPGDYYRCAVFIRFLRREQRTVSVRSGATSFIQSHIIKSDIHSIIWVEEGQFYGHQFRGLRACRAGRRHPSHKTRIRCIQVCGV